MYDSIIATDMFTLRGSHQFERMDDTQLADIGIERRGKAFVCDGKVVHEIRKFDARSFLNHIVSSLAGGISGNATFSRRQGT